jgi:hypothetical protein
MSQSTPDEALMTAFESWIKAQVLKLSVDDLRAGVLTCTTCPDSTIGEYIVEYQGQKLRLTPERTYAFLQFIAERVASGNVPYSSH